MSGMWVRGLVAAWMACAASLLAAGGEGDRLGRLRSLQKIRDSAAVEREARRLLGATLTDDQRADVHEALVRATSADKRIEALRQLPPGFPLDRGIALFVFAIADSQAYRSLDCYRLMVERFGREVTPEAVDRAARPLLNERRDWQAGAEAVAEAGLERFAGDCRLLDILAEAYRRTHRGPRSLELQRQALANAPTIQLKQQMVERLARNLRLQDRSDEAIEVRRRAIDDWPDDDWSRRELDALAVTCLRRDGLDKAVGVYDSYVQSHPKGKWVEACRRAVPELYRLDGQYDRAAAAMRRLRPALSERAQRELDRDIARLAAVEGQVMDEAGRAVAGATVTLARPSPLSAESGRLIAVTTRADEQGHFALGNLPHSSPFAFLAATKPDQTPTCLSTSFGPTDFRLAFAERRTMDIRFGRSPLKRLPDPPAPKPSFADGLPRRLVSTFVLREWSRLPWPRSPLEYALKLPEGIEPSSLRLVDSLGRAVDFQLTQAAPGKTGVLFFSDLPARATVAYFLFGCERKAEPQAAASVLQVRPGGGNTLEVSTGAAAFRVPAGPPRALPPELHVAACPPPILAVQGPDGRWRGQGRFVGRGSVVSLTADWIERGPLRQRLSLTYRHADGGSFQAILTFLAGEPYVLVREAQSSWPARFELSAHAGLQPDRAALCWINHLNVQAIACRQKRRLIQMPRYVMWSPPGEGDAAGFYRDGPDANDMISCFTVHPGDWVVQSMERWRARVLADRSGLTDPNAPAGQDTLEAYEDANDAYFAFPAFAGVRQWGLAVTDKSGGADAAADLRAQVGECPLDWYKDLVLDWDEAPPEAHPRLSAARRDLEGLARRARSNPGMARIVQPRRGWYFQSITYDRPPAWSDFLLTGDPLRGWQARNVAPQPDRIEGARRGKMRSAAYSPVGIRGTPYFSADALDALLAANLYSPEALREMRARMMLLAYALDGGDFMAWRYHAGHRNFDFSRIDAVAAYALLFPAHPDADRLIARCTNQLRESLNVFTTEGSGKWQENLGCYYLWSMRTAAAMNARILSAGWRDYDPFEWDRYRQFLMFAVRTVTPAHPLEDEVCRTGLAEGQSYASLPKGRRHPGVGDHGGNGGHPVYDGLGLTGLLAARSGHRQLASELLGAWKAGGCEVSGKAGLDIKGLLLANYDPPAVQAARMTPLASENLPGYGFAFRDGWGTDRETYLLFKCGTGGYRYHSSEGSFVLYAGNRPLSVDGDENIIPARHATLTLGPNHDYVGEGRIERHVVHPAVDYCRGEFASTGARRSILFARNDYFLIRDDANGPSHFVLPLLVRRIERRGEGFYCPGRLGLDVHVLPLGPPPQAVEIATDDLLDQQRLTISRPAGQGHLTLIAWSDPSAAPPNVTPFGPGYHVQGRGFDDYVFLTAKPVRFEAKAVFEGEARLEGKVVFDGRAGIVRLRGRNATAVLLDGTRITWGDSSP